MDNIKNKDLLKIHKINAVWNNAVAFGYDKTLSPDGAFNFRMVGSQARVQIHSGDAAAGEDG
jgi:hypothetical protein